VGGGQTRDKGGMVGDTRVRGTTMGNRIGVTKNLGLNQKKEAGPRGGDPLNLCGKRDVGPEKRRRGGEKGFGRRVSSCIERKG